jgi:hypothetical protein
MLMATVDEIARAKVRRIHRATGLRIFWMRARRRAWRHRYELLLVLAAALVTYMTFSVSSW